MNSLQIKEQRMALATEAKEITGRCLAEIRALTQDETERIEAIKTEIADLNEQLRAIETETNTENNNTNISTKNTMNKEFRLLKAIRNVVENKRQDELTQAVIEAGQNEMRAAGVNYVGQILLPNGEEYRTVTVTTEHDDVISTDMMNVLEPLHAKNVLINAGVKFLSGLKGDVQYPVMSTCNASWESETATNTNTSSPTYSNVRLTPHRLSVVVPVSKMFLVQDSVEAEKAIRDEIINAINAKLEATILGTSNGSTTQPAGLFYSASSLPTVSDFADLCDMEADIETANMEGYTYICSPKAKAILRSMSKGENTSASVWDGGEIDGVKCLVTSHIPNKGLICGSFAEMCLASWGSVDITVDPYTGAASGIIYLTVNSFWDFKPLRSSCYTVANVAANTNA